MASIPARLENQRQQTDNNEQTYEEDDADRSADKFQHDDCLLFVQRRVLWRAQELDLE